MTEESHDIDPWYIPDEEQVLANEHEKEIIEEEIELNEQLDTPKWVHTEEPDDGRCPYCGKEYKRAIFASNVKSAGKGVCPYPVEKHADFIHQFVHSYRGSRMSNVRTVGAYCSPEYEEDLVGGIGTGKKDYDLTNI